MTLDLDHDFVLNPDGSGRVRVRWAGPLGEGAPTAADFVRSELAHARGVEAWADVQCGPEGEQLVFAATAWFPDLSALRFHCQGFHVNLLDLRVDRRADGSVEVTSVGPRAAEGEPPAATSEAEARRMLATEREKLAMARSFLGDVFGSLRCRAVLRLPGPLAGDVPGERLAANAVCLGLDGAGLLAVIDRMMHDDAMLVRMLQDGGFRPEAALEQLGAPGPVSLRTAPGAEPQFDYAAEVAEAQARFAEFAAGMPAAPAAAAAEPLTNVRVVAARIVREADGERGLCPLGQDAPGVTLTIAADLPAPALEIEEASFERVVTDDGADLTPADAWDRQCHFPKTSRDGRTVLLEVSLRPAAAAAGFAELRGSLTSLASRGSEEHDLGFTTLGSGAEGEVAGARLLRVEQDDDQRWVLELKVQVPRARVLGCRLVAGDLSVPLTPAGYSACNDECEFTYRVDGDLPADARLRMTFAADLSRTTCTFALHDVDWLGRPL